MYPKSAVPLLSTGEVYSVFIDDTGTAGLTEQETVRFVAVVVRPEISPQIPMGMRIATDMLKQVTEATEFHFSDIYQAQGQFKGVPLHTRLSILRAMTSVFSDIIKPAIFVQSMDSETLKHVARQVQLPQLPSPLSLTSTRNFAFLGILARVCEYVAQTRSGDEEAVIFCDQGILKPGYALHIPWWPGTIHQNSVYFVDSNGVPGIQLADFAAFVLNRHQLLAQKQSLNSLDKTFLWTVEPIGQFFLNIDIKSIEIEYDSTWHLPYALQHL